MATLKKFWLRASAAVLTLLLGIGLFVNAMEKGEKVEVTERATTTYHFTGSDLSQATDSDFWSDDPQDAQVCDNEEELPCSVDLEEPIDDYLDGKSPAQIMADSNVNKRSQ